MVAQHSRTVFLIDMQSFFTSIEKVENSSLDDQPVVVAGDPKIRSGVILAACPLAKKWGVQTAEALWEAESKCPYLVVVKPRMQLYLDVSVSIAASLESFTDEVEPYSIDEIFVEMTNILPGLGRTAEEAAEMIITKIYRETGVVARVGIGPNKVMAKMACDHFSKKQPGGVFHLHENNLQEKLWPLSVGSMFGVGMRMARHFQDMGIRTIGQLARANLTDLRKRWGVNGELLFRTAHGRDESPVTIDTHIRRKAIGHHMTLPRDYRSWDEIKVVLLELSEEVARRVRANHYLGTTVTVSARGHDFFDRPSGFHRQVKLYDFTNDGNVIYETVKKLFLTHWNRDPVRSLGVSLDGLTTDEERQLSLFYPERDREMLNHTVDDLKNKYGSAAVLRASSLTAGGQALLRAQKLGGHYK
ncbi:DNA polymerase-4/DNA polymerase V [Geomicrobium halophilum]|uniref:DNA polymerase IV n=1 Tax=Geomicrobium halophilum TaxID=549000 RepID=A0A841Q169_9BACL|nr:DNA polymerase IV [Geomicrobium halophilum]MBB6451355.1 DNA polymerase-4/DNA polymerase V [Geomicrobium halophilum]